jgi:RHS repeat-associated protein
MKARFGLALLLVMAAQVAGPAAATEAPAPAISIEAASSAAHLPEPIFATRPTDVGEDRALREALAAYARRANPEDISSLTRFVAAYPQSGWSAGVWTNLGLSYLHYGYFSQALDAWQRAWVAGKDGSDPQARALVDRSVGELARLQASLGHNEELAQLFDQIRDRAVTGSATEGIQVAREELTLAKKDPAHLFLCGPTALRMLMLTMHATPESIEFLRFYKAGEKGTNLAELERLATKAHLDHHLVFRQAGQDVPVPSIVHWKVGHFATIVGQANGRFQIEDPVFPGKTLWVTQAALEAEASGYFLVPNNVTADVHWRTVASNEAAAVWGKGPSTAPPPGTSGPLDLPANPNNGAPDGGIPIGSSPIPSPSNKPGPACRLPMCGTNIGEATVSLSLSDWPVGYTPPIGPSVQVHIAYNQREDSQPANPTFFNIGPKWTLNWLAYVTDDPATPGASVSRYLSGGGAYYYTGYQSRTGLFAAQTNDGSILSLASTAPVAYRRELGDGSAEIYADSDGSTGYPRRIYLSQVLDPQGNAVTFHYDGQFRLTSLTDAVGRQTTLSYQVPGRPLLVSKITDPFGRSATLAYDNVGRLKSITDIIGITSSFTYDANSLVNSLTTPYGTTSFAYTAPGGSSPPRFVQITDPLGYNEREEWIEPAPVSNSEAPANVPVGMPLPPLNDFLAYRDSFHWDKKAYVLAGCTPSGGCDHTMARNRHFAHDAANTSRKSTTLESVKYPLENRIWFNYPDQTASYLSGSFTSPIASGRVLDDGTTQISRTSYDTAGFFKVTRTVDPLGRATFFGYGNGVDLSSISQAAAGGVRQLIAQWIYNTQHRPTFYVDAAGKFTSYTYNAAGQLTSVTNPLGQTISYQYNSTGDLTTITNANNQTAATFTYDAFDRVRTFTDSEGWSVTYDYDAADRLTKITYPDGTTDTYTYDKLDLASYQDREGRTWHYTHDANRRLTAVTNPLGQQTVLGYDENNNLTSLTDPGSNTTTWSYDVQSRLIQKKYADNSTVTYTYEATTSRLKSVLDALGQSKQFTYANDNRLTAISYLNAVNPTPNVALSYDPFFSRVTSMTDGIGTTTYSYVPVGAPGALQRQQEVGPLANAAIGYTYDALGRLASRTVTGAGVETFGYDAIGRLTSHASDLGSFTLGYLGQTDQITSRQLASSTLATTWGYLPNSGDRRLASIGNTGLSAAQFSNYQFTTTPENFISAIDESSDSAAVYPSAGSQTASYNNLNQLTNLSGQALTYDANGNLTADGQRTYSWDAENRLVGIGYPSQAGKQTAFAYDGLSRRITIASTPAGGGSAVMHSYVWCGAEICQARNAANAASREYYSEGELVPGSPSQPYFYGTDQIGSVRRAFASASSAPAYGYDPYGSALQATTPPTDFGYAGMFYNADSGLYLTQFRGYDAVGGRWLSRDPIGESSDPAANLYAYVGGNPVNRSDPLGLLSSGNHIEATKQALGSNLDNCPQLPQDVAGVDFLPHSQDAENAYWHAMSDGTHGQTSAAAETLYNKYVAENSSAGTLQGLAQALHAVQDSVASGHVGFQPWNGGNWPFGQPSAPHIYGDFSPSQSVMDSAVAKSREILAPLNLPSLCGCGSQ